MIISCSKNHGDEKTIAMISPEEKLIGSWQYFKYMKDGFSWELDKCEKKITYQFLQNGGIIAELYLKNETEECFHTTAPGQWYYLKNQDKFEIGLNGTGLSMVGVIFSEDDNILTIINKQQGEVIDAYSFHRITN